MSNDNNNDNEEEYKVGYKKPPKEHQFKPKQSGNKRGRPRGAKNKVNLGESLNKSLLERRQVTINGKKVSLKKSEIIAMAQIERAMKGDIKSAQFIFKVLEDYKSKDKNNDAPGVLIVYDDILDDKI